MSDEKIVNNGGGDGGDDGGLTNNTRTKKADVHNCMVGARFFHLSYL